MASPIEVKIKRQEVEIQERWTDDVNDTAPLRFHSDWEVQIVPPFHGAMARFHVMHKGRIVSVYYDTKSALGLEPCSYYELYCDESSYNDGDPVRVLANVDEKDVARQIFSIINGMLGDDKVYPEPQSVEETTPEPPPAEVFEPCKHCGSTTVECLWDKEQEPPCG